MSPILRDVWGKYFVIIEIVLNWTELSLVKDIRESHMYFAHILPRIFVLIQKIEVSLK